MKRYLIAALVAGSMATPGLAAAGQHYVVEDTEKFCSVIDAAPSKNLKVLGDKQGYGSRDQAEQALKGINCKAVARLRKASPLPTGRRKALSPLGRGELMRYGLGFDFGLAGFGLSPSASVSSGRCN